MQMRKDRILQNVQSNKKKRMTRSANGGQITKKTNFRR